MVIFPEESRLSQSNQENTQASPADGAVRLQRSLGLWNLIIIGMVIVQPTAPMGIYGVISNKAHGHVVTTILIAMVAMLFTAISYGRMARVYPSAGSAYTYVGQEIHSGPGLCRGLGHGDGLPAQPAHLHGLLRQGGDEHRSRPQLLRVDRPLHCVLYLGEPARRKDLSAG